MFVGASGVGGGMFVGASGVGGGMLVGASGVGGGIVVGATGAVGETGVGGSGEISKQYFSLSWHMAPFGGSASTLISAQNSAPAQRSMSTIGLTLVESPGETVDASSSPNKSFVAPPKVKSSTVMSMSTSPVLLISTV